MGVIRASKRRSAKRLSLARSLDDLEVGTNFLFFYIYIWTIYSLEIIVINDIVVILRYNDNISALRVHSFKEQ